MKKVTFGLICLIMVVFAALGACAEKTPEDGQPSEVPVLNETSANLTVGETIDLEIGGYDGAVIWSSSNENIATVENGTVTAQGEGAAYITATAGDRNLTCTINVTETPIGVAVLMLDKISTQVHKGYTLTLTPYIRVGHETADISGIAFVWTSENGDIATVEDGVVTGISAGTVKICVSCVYEGETLSAECDLTVVNTNIYKVYSGEEEVTVKNPLRVLVSDAYLGTEDDDFVEVRILEVDAESGETVGDVTSRTTLKSLNEVAVVDGNRIGGGTVSGEGRVSVLLGGEEIGEIAVEGWTKISNRSQMNALALATWNLRNGEENIAKMERVLGGNYVLVNDIDYGGEYLLPIANAWLDTSVVSGINDDMVSYQSLTWKKILSDPEIMGESAMGEEDWEKLYFNKPISSIPAGAERFKGTNPLQKPFTGKFDGNGYSIKNAQLVADNILTTSFWIGPTADGTVGYFTASASQFLGLNEGILRNIGFDNLHYTAYLPEYGTTDENRVPVYSEFGDVSRTYYGSMFSSGSGLVYHNAEGAVVENIRIDFSSPRWTDPAGGAKISPCFGVNRNDGTVKNIVLIQNFSTTFVNPGTGGTMETWVDGANMYYLNTINNGVIENGILLINGGGVAVQYVRLAEENSELENCAYFNGASEFDTAVKSGVYLLDGFGKEVWEFSTDGAGVYDGGIDLINGNFWNFSEV